MWPTQFQAASIHSMRLQDDCYFICFGTEVESGREAGNSVTVIAIVHKDAKYNILKYY
jgi:hypothetical protein